MHHISKKQIERVSRIYHTNYRAAQVFGLRHACYVNYCEKYGVDRPSERKRKEREKRKERRRINSEKRTKPLPIPLRHIPFPTIGQKQREG